MDDVERPADAGGGGVGDHLRAGVEHFEAVWPGLPAELGTEVGRAEEERRHSRARRDLVCETQALRRLDDRDHRRPVGAERGDGLGRRLRQDEGLQLERTGSGEVVLEPARPRAVDSDDRGTQPKDDLAGVVLPVERDGVLEVGDDGVGFGGEGLRQLRLVGAVCEEQRAEVRKD